jgi:protein-S-isoprenylcysteine O-methyltransferase Ste14
MSRITAFAYGVVCYALALITIVYAIGFVADFAVPKSIDSGPSGPAARSFAVDVLLLLIFAVQHSVMARKPFKRWWSRFVPEPVERSTYVLLASLALILVFWQWQPIPEVVWQIEDQRFAIALTVLSYAGWSIVLASTFLINHFELFGLHQVTNHLSGRAMPTSRFRTPLFYKVVRHPLYLGFIIAFWAATTMTVGHLLFAVVTTFYILAAIGLEERDLIDTFGHDYRRYRRLVPMLVPLARRRGRP